MSMASLEAIPQPTAAAPKVLSALGAIAVVVALWVASYWHSVSDIVGIWTRSETFAHGFVIAPISAYLIWIRRHQLAASAVRPAWSVLPLVCLGIAGWLLGRQVSVAAIEHLAVVAVLVFSIWCAIGHSAFRVIAFPIGFLMFMAPVGEFLLPVLMHYTAEFTVGALRLTGIPVYQESLFFVVPNGRWSVVEACSGIRYLIASFMVGTLFAYLAHVGLWGVGLILGVVLLFFLRFRTLLAMFLTIGVGCVWAFGAARLTVGYLNTATGFLVSIIAGNGINFGIIFMARFLEARRDEKLSTPIAIRVSHRDTHTATLAAAGAAMIAYGSLASTDFHGFKHFGIIGGVGMILCWIATYMFLPAFLVLSERYAPMFTEKGPAWRARMKGLYGYPFAIAARKFPRAIAIGGALLGVGAIVLTVRYFAQDPMEYDLAHVRNERLSPTSAGRLSLRVDKIVGRLGQDGRAILTDDISQVKPLVAELEKRRDAVPKKDRPFDKVVSVYDLLPDHQAEKLKLLRDIDDRLERAKKHGFISDEDWKKLEEHIPTHLEKLTIADLPELVARPFTEKDGRRGNIVYIVPTEGRSVYDAHYLLEWADSFRTVKLPDGSVIHGTGDPVIFADMLINIGEDAPKAILLSLVGTLLVILFAFRGKSAGWLALAALLLGVSWLIAYLALRDIKLNFLNFVALPISIGVGADYAINVMKRRQIEGDEVLYSVLVQTGGAVVLCSLTTTLGYVALLLSINRAVQSFGLAAAVGEVTTLVSAVLVLPAVLFWRARRMGVELSPSSIGRPTIHDDLP